MLDRLPRSPSLLIAALAACFLHGPLQGMQSGPALVLEDSVELRESTEHYLSDPAALIVADDGSYFIADRFSNSVLRFGRDGGFRRAFGRVGQEPGEFTVVGVQGFVAEDLLGFVDLRPMSLEIFEVSSGRYRNTVEFAEATFPLSFSVHDETLWTAGMDRNAWKAIGAHPIRHVSSRGADAVISLDRVTVPRPYIENPMVFGVLAFTVIDVSDDDLVVGFGASPNVLRTDHAGNVLDTLVFPSVRRRGLPDEDELASLDPRETSIPELVESISALTALSRDERGSVLALHQDFDLGERRAGGGYPQQADFYVSSIQEDGSGVCPDTLVPTLESGVAKAALRAGSLYVLEQSLDDRGSPKTVIRRFRIESSDCTGRIIFPRQGG